MGAPYHFGSAIRPQFDRDRDVHESLRQALVELFPALADAAITHRWGGPLGIARDWFPSVGLDRATGLAWAGGYVGDGVSTTNLAGRTLCDLILRRTTERTALPWVGHRSQPMGARAASLPRDQRRPAPGRQRRSGRGADRAVHLALTPPRARASEAESGRLRIATGADGYRPRAQVGSGGEGSLGRRRPVVATARAPEHVGDPTAMTAPANGPTT